MTKTPVPSTNTDWNRPRSSALQAAGVLMGCLLALAVLALLLQKEMLGRKSSSQSRTPVARLLQGERLVQRKYDREVIWDDVVQGEILYNRDSIRTAKGSQAKIEFDDGTLLDLAENSLVVLDRSDSRIKVEFVKGSMSARGGVEIRTASGRLQLGQSGGGKGALNLSSTGGSLEVNVTEGAAKLLSAKGEAALGPEEQARLGASGIEKRRILIKPRVPAAGARFIAPESGARVVFAWNRDPALDPEARIQLQVAADPEFTTELNRRDVSRESQSTEVLLSHGGYYWRLVAQRAGKIIDASPARVIAVIRASSARLAYPEKNQKFTYFREKPEVRFSWNSSISESGVDRIEISKDREFKNPIRLGLDLSRTARIRSGTLQGQLRESVLHAFDPGQWYWRVVTRFDRLGPDADQIREVSSENRSVSVTQLNRLAAPRLIDPPAGAVMGQSTQTSQIRFRWAPVAEARKYKLLISSDPGFKQLVTVAESLRPEWSSEIQASGTLYWKVQATQEQDPNASSQFSEARVFTFARTGGFKLVSPRKDERLRFVDQPKPISLAWEPRGGASRYEVQLASDSDFKDLVLTEKVDPIKVSGSVVRVDSMQIPVGSFFWRVRAYDSKGSMTDLSETGRFTHESVPILGAIEKLSPPSQAVIAPEPLPRVLFEWKPVAEASKYFFELWMQDSTGKPEKIWSGGLTSSRWERQLESGTYHWNVRAIDALGREGAASTNRQLSIRFKDRLAPPLVIAPAPGTRVVKSSPEEVPLRWEAVKGARSYIVSWKRFAKDGKVVSTRQAKVEGTEFLLPNTTPAGKYIWEVTALGAPLTGGPQTQVRQGEPSRTALELDWKGSLHAPARLKVSIESDRAPAAKAVKKRRAR